MHADQLPAPRLLYQLPGLLTVGGITLFQIADQFALPGYLSEVLISFGAILIILGASAYVTSGPGTWARSYGRWLFFCGIIMAIVGFDFSGFVALIRSLMRGG